MKSWSIVSATLMLLALVTHAQGSITLQVTYTGDNVVAAFYKDGGSPTPVPGFVLVGGWQSPQTTPLSGLGYGQSYELIFQVYNDRSSNLPFGVVGNPAGFLAEVKGPVTSGVATTLTSTSWEYVVDTTQGGPVTSAFVGSLSGWASVTAWGYQLPGGTNTGQAWNGGNNIWTGGNGGNPIAGISSGASGANWIWSSKNGVALGPDTLPDPENWLFIRTTITTATPEPSTIIVWSLLGMGSWLGMRIVRRRRGGPVGRQPWSPENRQAIHDIIARGTHR